MAFFIGTVCGAALAAAIVAAFCLGLARGRANSDTQTPNPAAERDRRAQVLLSNIERYDGSAVGQRVVK